MPAKGFFPMRFALLCGIGIVTGHVARGQFLEPPDVNLFGDSFVKSIEIQNNGGIVFTSSSRGVNAPKNDGYENLLLFQDGRQLRGRMESVGKNDIVWKRPDFSEPLHLRREDVHQVFLTPENSARNGNVNPVFVMDNTGRRVARNAVQGATTPATIKLGGEDWLHGDVTSPDGQSFVLSMDKSGDTITVPRSQVEWLYFDANPARGGGFDGSMRGMDEWLAAAPSASLIADETLQISSGEEWIGRPLPQPRYFEISLEVSADTEQGSHLWLQPFVTSPNSFGPGTVDVEFGPKEMSVRRFFNNMDQKKFPIPESGTPDSHGMVHYRIFYDSDEQHIVIFRNGKTAVDAKPEPLKPGDPAANLLSPQISNYAIRMSIRAFVMGACLSNATNSLDPSSSGLSLGSVPDLLAAASHWSFASQFLLQQIRARHPRILQLCLSGTPFSTNEGDGKKASLKIRRFRVNPWDGNLPKDGEGPLTEDRLSVIGGETISGKLESISDKDIAISQPAEPKAQQGEPKAQRTMPKAPGILLRVPRATIPLGEEVAKIDLGTVGEISASALETRDGKAHIRTSFADDVVFPTTTLKSIDFPAIPPAKAAKSDTLVFKNGDELPGTLLSAVHGARVRWKLPSGQEVEIEIPHLAGIRFASHGTSKPAPESALVELRNGDRLRGTVVSFDEKQLGLKQSLLGSLSVERPQLWKVYPLSTAGIRDGADAPADWIRTEVKSNPFYYRNPTKKKTDPELSWLYLDGFYLPRQTRRQNGQVEQMFLTSLVPHQDNGLFEVRAEITGTGGNPPNGMFAIHGKQNENGGASGVFANFSYSELYVNIMSDHGQKSRQVAFGAKLGKISTRLSLRLFVNSTLGTVDIMLDGVVLARIGQQTDERTPGIGESAQVGGVVYDGHPIVISNVWVGPWDGELPRPETVSQASTALANGDASAGVPSVLKDDRYLLETEIGPLQLPAAAVSAIAFGGEYSPVHAAARLRLVDSSVVHLTQYECRDGVLTGHSDLFGELHLPLESVAEFIFDPLPLREPKGPAPKKPVHTADAETPKPNEQK